MDDSQDLNRAQGQPLGLLDSVRRLLGTVAGIAQTRIELLGTEVEEQVAYFGWMLLWAIVAVFLAFTAAVLVAVTILVLFWDTNRILAAVLLASAFAAMALVAWLRVVSIARKRPHLFQATLEELGKDRHYLGEK
jgi:uncharacterized membrane protein YqjE